jgi:hypothetical protein
MATKKISELDAKTSLAGTEEFLINDGGTSKKVTASALSDLYSVSAAFTWDSTTSSPAASFSRGLPRAVEENLYNQMKGCVLNSDGTVNYYLSATDWTQKAGGGASVLTGADGNVMVEIPAFYYRTTRSGSLYTWEVSHVALPGFTLHPAFVKDGVEVAKRYFGAYDACVYDVSATAYLSGLNYDNNDGGNGVGVDVTATTGDKLASVSGIYPMLGLTRGEFRTTASNNGTGWRQLDFTLWSAVQMLYLIEYQSFYSQNILGAGNTNGSYLSSSGDQNDSPHTIAGIANSLGNASTDGTQASAGAKPGTAYMKYRGIENLYGNCWTWADGILVNDVATGNVYIGNDSSDWSDSDGTGMNLVTSSYPTASSYVTDLLPVEAHFLASNGSGGSSSTYITDQQYKSSSSDRVVLVGGAADNGGNAGVFCVYAVASSFVRRSVGGRLAF